MVVIVNRKGYTLIEVIMVIAIISLLALILIPSSLLVIDKAKENSCEKLKGNIISAAKMYVNDSKYEMNFNCSNGVTKTVTLQTLNNKGYLTIPKGGLKNPITDASIELNSNVSITYHCDKKDFTYEFSLTCEKSK